MRRFNTYPLRPDAPVVTRDDVALLRAAASLAASVEGRRRAGHLEARLHALADRMEALLPPLDAAA